MTRQKTVIILLICMLCFFISCKKRTERPIEITLGNFDSESRDKANRGIVIEEISQNISYSKDSNVIMVYFFANLTGDENYDYLKEGLIDYIINMAKIGQVEFVDTSTLWSKLRLKNITNPDTLSIASVLRVAKELNVKYLITGNFKTYQDEIVISATLRRVDDGFIIAESTQKGLFSKLFEVMDRLTADIFSDEKIAGFSHDSEYKSGITIDTDNPEAYNHYLQGIYYANNFKNEEAYQEFKKAVSLDKKFGSAHIKLIILSAGKDRDENIDMAVENKLHFNQINQLLLEFVILDKRIYWEKAYELASRIDKLNEEVRDPEISYLIFVNLYMHSMDEKSQIEYLKNIIHYNPFYENAYNLLGYKFSDAGDYENAFKYLNQYAVLLPDSPNPHDSLGDLYKMLDDYGSAEEEYKKALDIDKTFFFSYQNLLTVYEMNYRHKDATDFTNRFFRRFLDESTANIDRLISLSTAYLLFSHQSMEYVHYRNLSSYILYLLRNGFIYDAIDLIERWHALILSKGSLQGTLSGYPHDFIYYFGQPVLIKNYLTRNYSEYIRFLELLSPSLGPNELIAINNYLKVYYNDEKWFRDVMEHFGLYEKSAKILNKDCDRLQELFYKGEYLEARKLYESIEKMEFQDAQAFIFFAMQIDLKLGKTNLVRWYEINIKKFRANFVHYNLYAGMLEELKGNYSESLRIYSELREFIQKNNSRNFDDIVTDILDERISSLQNR